MNGRVLRRRTVLDSAPPLSATPLLQRIYSMRGVRSSVELDLTLERLIPVRELGVDAAVELMIQHHRAASRVLVVGDFDADGATSTALMVRQLRRLGFADVRFMVPNRFKFGYGLTPEIVNLAAEQKPALIVTVDNGISSHAGVEAAREHGIQVLVTDHHLPGATLPAAAAIVNPNVPGNGFASKSLAGVGVAFYLLAALTRAMQERGYCGGDNLSVAQWLDIVAVGTVADVVPLDANNRILVQQGLRRIRAGRCVPGIRALLEAAGRRLDSCCAADLGFQVGPRLNAAGRLDDMSLGIECLLTDDPEAARRMAAQLAQLNHERRDIEQQMQHEALEAIERMKLDAQNLPLGLCLYEESWHQGVVGLVASRVKERLHRPVIAMARADEATLKGSARSVPGVHIRDVLDAVATRHPGLIEKFGGHAMAAGLSISADNLSAFRAAFDAEVCRWMSHDDAIGVVYSDGELLAAELSLEVARQLRAAGPWGQGFPEPIFDGRFRVMEVRILGERHLKLKVKVGDCICEAIAFRHLDRADAPEVRVDNELELAYRLDVNEYQGIERLQLVVEHLQTLVSTD